VSERSRHRQRRLDRHRLQARGKRLEIGIGPRPGALGEPAHVLHELVHVGPLAGAQRLAEQLAEQPDVVAERLVRIGAHVSVPVQRSEVSRQARVLRTD
jgi:hypothetical protein